MTWLKLGAAVARLLTSIGAFLMAGYWFFTYLGDGSDASLSKCLLFWILSTVVGIEGMLERRSDAGLP